MQWKKDPSAFRFHLLIKFLSNNFDESIDLGLIGRLFWVHPLGENHRPQCVLVLSNGSFASSSGNFASYGRPDVYCWAVIARGYAYFNPFLHLHSTYLVSQPEVDICKQNAAAKLDRPGRILPSNASWNHAVKLADDAWKRRNNLSRQDSEQGSSVDECILYPMTIEMTAAQADRLVMERTAFFLKLPGSYRDSIMNNIAQLEQCLREEATKKLHMKLFKKFGTTNIPLDTILQTSLNDKRPVSTRRICASIEKKKSNTNRNSSLLAKRSVSSDASPKKKKRKETFSLA